MPKVTLFGWLSQTPSTGWASYIKGGRTREGKSVGVPEVEWYDEATLSRGSLACHLLRWPTGVFGEAAAVR